MKKFLFMFLIVLLLVSSCNQEDNVEISKGPFVGGSNGLSLSFVEGAPSTEFLQGENVPVKLFLKNNGEYDLGADLIETRLYGVHMSSFSLNSDWTIIGSVINGIQKGIDEEGVERIVDIGQINYVPNVDGFVESTLFAKICYPYQTRASIDICVNSKEIEDSGVESVCEITGEKIKSGSVSSGPIQITSFTETFESRDGLNFKIKLENKGTGNVYVPEIICSELGVASDILKEDKIYIIFPEDITCFFLDGEESNEGYVKIGETSLSCHLDVENTGSNYRRIIELFVDYKYIESTSIDLSILEA
jgi:hypothetical protein